jgi:predicted GNAT superfamily acetyltransferase
MIDIRVLHTIPELEALIDLELVVWGLDPRDAVPSTLMHVIALRGGLALGAYEDETMIGLLLALPVKEGHEWILWSHMTGTHPDHQGKGIGAALKRYQREWALEQGYRRVGWTVDPLQRGNAHFNFHLLGGDAALTTNIYHVNFYGDMDDAINRGMPSDRIEVIWHVDQPCLHDLSADAAPLLLHNDQNAPLITLEGVQWDASAYRVALPRDLDAIRRVSQDNLLAWRMAVSDVLQAAFAHGYSIVDFLSPAAPDAYVLNRIE